MIAHQPTPVDATSCLADDLWKELRGLADDGLARRASAAGAASDNRVRGEVYLFIVDVIAHEVDRLEQEAGAGRGRSPEKGQRIVDLAPSDWTCHAKERGPDVALPQEKRHGG